MSTEFDDAAKADVVPFARTASGVGFCCCSLADFGVVHWNEQGPVD